MREIVGLIFFFSGASGLVYQVIWTRQLMLIFGSTVFAVSTVLTAFMAGLGLGSFYFGKLADRDARPLRLYAILEMGIGIYALILPFLLIFVKAIYVLIYRSLGAEFYSLSIIRFILTFFLIVMPTAMMGGTLPVIGRFVVDRFDQRGLRIGTFYAINTFGAAIGTIATGFFLIRYIGISGSNYLAVSINLIIAIVAFLIDGKWSISEAGVMSAIRSIQEKPQPTSVDDRRWRMVLIAFAIAGFCSLAYEVLWTRILVFFLGSTTFAFATMLSAFLIGIAIGSVIFAKFADRVQRLNLDSFGLIEIGVGLSAILVLPIFHRLFDITQFFQKIPGGRLWAFVACVLVMIVPTVLMGGVFPIVIRIYSKNEDFLGRDVGEIYAANTLGAIFGAFCSGFILIPIIGIRPSIVLIAMINVAIGIWLIMKSDQRSKLIESLSIGGGVISIGGAILVIVFANKPFFLKSAIFRVQRPGDELIDYREEIDASVTTLKDDENIYRLYVDTNQAADASRWDSPSHRVIAHLPLLLHPDPKNALVVGVGMGLTSHSITQHGVRVDAIEISKGVIDAMKTHFRHVNRDLIDNPLFNFEINDGRNYILMTEKKYDLISTGIIHPLVSAGSSNIYTADFYRLCRRILSENGVMCQWVPLHRVPIDHLKMIIATFAEVFPNTTLWYKYTPDFVILIGTREPLQIDFKNFIARSKIPSIRDGLAADDLDGMSLIDSFMFGEDTIRKFTRDVEIHTDDHPKLEFFDAKKLVNTTWQNVEMLSKFRERVTPWMANYGDTIDEKRAVRAEIDRYFKATQKLIEGQILYAKGELVKSAEKFTTASNMNADDQTIKYNLQVAIGATREGDLAQFRALEKEIKNQIRTDPNNADLHFQLVVIYEAQGKLADAVDACETAIKLDPDRVEFYIFLGPIYERLENYQKALRTYLKLETIADGLPAEISVRVAWFFLADGNPKKAIEYAEKTENSEPETWGANYTLALIYFDQKNYRSALNAINKAISAKPNDPELENLRQQIQEIIER